MQSARIELVKGLAVKLQRDAWKSPNELGKRDGGSAEDLLSARANEGRASIPTDTVRNIIYGGRCGLRLSELSSRAKRKRLQGGQDTTKKNRHDPMQMAYVRRCQFRCKKLGEFACGRRRSLMRASVRRQGDISHTGAAEQEQWQVWPRKRYSSQTGALVAGQPTRHQAAREVSVLRSRKCGHGRRLGLVVGVGFGWLGRLWIGVGVGGSYLVALGSVT